MRTPISICGFANLIFYRKTVWKWTLLFSEVNVGVLMTFFSVFGGQRLGDDKKFDLQKKGHHEDKVTGNIAVLSLQKCNEHLRLQKCKRLRQTYRKLVDICGCEIVCKFAVPSSDDLLVIAINGAYDAQNSTSGVHCATTL